MKLLVPLVLAGVVAGLVVCVVGTFVLDLVDRLKHRGEVADRPLPDPDVFDQDAVLAGSDLIDAMVPQGTGERIAREIQDYFKEIQR